MPGRRTSALSKVETDSAVERPRTKDVRRATSPFDAGAMWSERQSDMEHAAGRQVVIYAEALLRAVLIPG